MAAQQPTPDRLLQLLDAVCDGRASAEESAELNAALKNSPEARRAYIQYMDMEANIRRLHAPQPTGLTGDLAKREQNKALAALQDQARPTAATPATPNIASPSLRQPLRVPVGKSLSMVSKLSAWRIAALFIFIASAVMTLTSPTWMSWWRSTPVATLADAVNAQWDEAQGRLDVGDHLPYGPLFLKSGYASIRLDNGVKLVLVGPAHFSVDSLTLAHLDEGKLTADVPHTASGYSVKIPSGMVTDLGTTFGITAFANKECTVQVLKGSVQAQLFSDDGKQKDQVVLTEEHAVALSPFAGTLSSIPAEPDAYVTNIRRIPAALVLHNTGQGLKPGDADPYWQITANSSAPSWTPRSAIVADQVPSAWTGHPDSAASAWLSARKGFLNFPSNCRLTFVTTLDLTGFDPQTVRLHLSIRVDDELIETRLNGQKTSIEMVDRGHKREFRELTLDQGFVAGKNTLEFVVQNDSPSDPYDRGPNPMGFRAVLAGTAVRIEAH
jgi:hypothetical protein